MLFINTYLQRTSKIHTYLIMWAKAMPHETHRHRETKKKVSKSGIHEMTEIAINLERERGEEKNKHT